MAARGCAGFPKPCQKGWQTSPLPQRLTQSATFTAECTLRLWLTILCGVTDGTRVRWVSQALSEGLADFAPTSETNAECNLHSRMYLEALANSTLWAVQMLDASSQTAAGMLSGDIYSLGHYDQCITVEVPELRIRGQHCLATLHYGPDPEAFPWFYTPSNVTHHRTAPTENVWDKVKFTGDPGFTRRDLFHWALCIPASCSPEDLEQSLNISLEMALHRNGLRGRVTVDPLYCHKAGEVEVPASGGYFTIRMVLLMCVLISIIATVYDYVMPYVRDQKFESHLAGMSEKMLLAFSIRKNMNELTEKGADPRLDIINGGKVISIAAILFGHRALYSHGLALQYHEDWEWKLEHDFSTNALMNATHLVDVFFLASGFLAFLGIYNHLDKKKSINFLLIIFLRWVRIVPPYLVMMGIMGWILPTMSEGPLWDKRVGLEAQRCQDNWWVNLLFINNYYHADNQCLLLSWYLACDMQFFIIGMFATYILWKWPKLGYVVFGVLLTVSIAVPFYATYAGKYYGILRLYASSLLVNPFKNDHFINIYVKSHNRAGPYIIGALTGYLCIKLSKANYKFSKRTILLGFIVLFGGGYTHQFYGFLFYQRDRPYNGYENAFYAAFHRITFSIGVAWAALTYYTTGFGLFKVLLAQQIYTPLCRLVYCVVLIHPVLQLAEAASVRHSEFMNYPKMFWMACGDYLTATLLALPLYLMVEAPFRTILKLMFMTKKASPAIKQSTTQAVENNTEQPKLVISRL
ncbi:nose resistant to fluoxetine protein 6-like [Macrosteles quadrilineatus]|uniref:nose resistant to fluoxetine protein 6-like n=1 Tax=Macrosteles quadrilineatus TaxID=74068 RepID=UPI0023E34DE3|nr:nose resistant to fluoxetine protein 6-like [Macrosteles quadrilineatus]